MARTGRPSSYKPEFVAMLDEFFDISAGEDIMAQNKKGEPVVVRKAAALPTLAAFACKIGVHRETLREWADAADENGVARYPEFSAAYKRAREHQERILTENGLLGAYQPAFAIFTAKNVLGWRDKTETEISGPDGGPIETKDVSSEELARRLAFLLMSGAKESGRGGSGA